MSLKLITTQPPSHINAPTNLNKRIPHILNDQERAPVEEKQSASAHSEKLRNQYLLSSFGQRAKRSSERPLPPDVENIHQVNEDELLDRHEDNMRLDPERKPMKPICSRMPNNSPNPPVPSGYDNWEAFLASEGEGNDTMSNPQQELRNDLPSKVGMMIMIEQWQTDRAYIRYYNQFKTGLNAATDRETAIAVFNELQRKIDNAYGILTYKMKFLTEAMKEQMKKQLQEVRYGTPNRWIDSRCWTFTSNEGTWNRRWNERYLPKALHAVSSVTAGMNHVINRPRNNYLQKGINDLRDYFVTKGWEPHAISKAEDIPLPPVPAKQHVVSQSTRGAEQTAVQ